MQTSQSLQRHWWRWACVLFVLSGSIQTLLGIATAQDPVVRSDWPQWRGPNRDNISPERGLLQEWPEQGPNLVWRADGLGRGIASVAVADGKVYSIGHHFPRDKVVEELPGRTLRGRGPRTRTVVPQGEYIIALDARTGELLWATRVGEAVLESTTMRWLSQRTPTVDIDRLYVLTAAGDLICLRTDDGFELWRKSYGGEFGGVKAFWGYCDYPLVDGDLLICTPGGSEATVVALNKLSGDLIWTCSVPDAKRHAHAATIVTEASGLRQYVTFLESGLIGVSAADGKLLWEYKRFAHRLNALTPIVRGDKILSVNGYRGAGVARLGFRENDKEGLSVEEEIFSQLPGQAISAFQDNTVLVDQRFYSAGRSGALACIDADTLQIIWDARAPITGQSRARVGGVGMLYADQRLYVRYGPGIMTLVQPQDDGYLERGAFSIPDSAGGSGVTMPVIAGGHLFLRDDERLFCYDIREKEEPAETKIVHLNLGAHVGGAPNGQSAKQTLRSVFVPTPKDVVGRMLELAEVKKDDVVCDLGSGDGRIVIAAAKRFGCNSIGYEISEELIEASRRAAELSGVQRLATFEQKDIFEADLTGVSVVTLYLLVEQNRRLITQLEQLPPGSRIVAYQNPIPGVRPDRVIRVESEEDADLHTLYLWKTPLTTTASDGSEPLPQ